MAKYDFMSFGEAMVRFTPPGHDRLGQAEVLELGIAAAELNCCVNISNLSRKLLKPTMKTAYVTKLVQNAAVDNNSLLSELADASREVRFTMEEASGMYEEENTMNLADIEREFEELLSEESSGQGEEIEKAVWMNG